ncbi:MAG: four helix bundle protein [Prevotella sp.]|jgi:four helix bundle protein|nr:four helix bundle protein [Prevotella sp.]
MQDYRNLKVWVKAHNLTLSIYKITVSFPKEEIYSLTSQLRRSMISIPANIAEGAGRNTKLDFAQFLNISLGSLNESLYYLLLAKDLNYIRNDEYIQLDMEANELKAMLIALINSVRKSNS